MAEFVTDKKSDVVVVGSVAIDTVETPYVKRVDVLGGAASYSCMASSFFAKTGMVGVVGSDFPPAYRLIYERAGVDLQGLQVKEGQTFRWAGVYEANMDKRATLSTDLNVFESFMPVLPPDYCRSPFLFLANIAPNLQLHVLDQVEKPLFVMADTMDLWINTTRPSLDKLIARVDLLTLNEAEARQLTDCLSVVKAAHMLLERGPRYVIVKKGENGSALFSKEGVFLLPAYPVEEVVDPTGAGDVFAGALVGALARQGQVNLETLKEAMAYGNVVASFVIEDFSVGRLTQIDLTAINRRLKLFKKMVGLA